MTDTLAQQFVDGTNERKMVPICRHGDYMSFLRSNANERKIVNGARYTPDGATIVFPDESEAVRVRGRKFKWEYEWQIPSELE